MKPYIVIVHKDENSAYGMTFPDAPGCFSAADEIDDLFAMAGEALELWAEGMREDGLPIPEPRDFETLRADAGWGGRFADAEIAIAVEAPWAPPRQAAERFSPSSSPRSAKG
ncbi:type II toxin-antitoxin system HicB family antitoxin [Methylocystis sp. WRRC1]|uniref:type II toxin-antitoxin system HicB family antitoxin n=1 Tax=Methylocystis sp. WRRC1 TaxID=1732014 RepID=UPI001D1467B6|nr:type II toxin-antitoxin system HicB family antitoxin [Methylocystis sp. WRRC1]MCC3245958.1 type II toxin-antitoxin system HicB family antitoxin [Methylocystis sp. WRRC1]